MHTCFMFPRRPGHLLVAVLALAGASCATTPRVDTVPKRNVPKAEVVHLILVATNDWHGQLFATREPSQATLPQGGAQTFFAMLSAIREAFPGSVLWVDGGDITHGEGAFHEEEGGGVVDAFSMMGLDFAALGSSDFDYGPLGSSLPPWGRRAPPSIPGGEPPAVSPAEPQGALKAGLLRARFLWSSANIYSRADGRRPEWLGGDALPLVERQGIQVGFIGLTTPTTAQTSYASHVEGLYFGDMLLAVEERALALREKGADLVILAAHAGGECARWDNPLDVSSCDTKEGELWGLLEALPEGLIDAVIAGHGQGTIGHFFKGLPVVKSGGKGKYFSLIHFYWEPTERRLLREKTRLEAMLPIHEGEEALFMGRPLEANSELGALLEPAEERYLAGAQEALGIEIGTPLPLGEGEESALGGLWAESLWLATQADMALMNRRALKEPLEAGALSARSLFQSMPYDSRVAVVGFRGEELKRLVQMAFGQTRFRFDIAGAELKLSCMPSGRRRVQMQLVSVDGRKRAVQDKAFYWVAMPDFLAQGGEGLEGMFVGLPPRQVKLRKGMREEMLQFWRRRQQTLVAPLRPRILWEDGLDSCGKP